MNVTELELEVHQRLLTKSCLPGKRTEYTTAFNSISAVPSLTILTNLQIALQNSRKQHRQRHHKGSHEVVSHREYILSRHWSLAQLDTMCPHPETPDIANHTVITMWTLAASVSGPGPLPGRATVGYARCSSRWAPTPAWPLPRKRHVCQARRQVHVREGDRRRARQLRASYKSSAGKQQ